MIALARRPDSWVAFPRADMMWWWSFCSVNHCNKQICSCHRTIALFPAPAWRSIQFICSIPWARRFSDWRIDFRLNDFLIAPATRDPRTPRTENTFKTRFSGSQIRNKIQNTDTLRNISWIATKIELSTAQHVNIWNIQQNKVNMLIMEYPKMDVKLYWNQLNCVDFLQIRFFCCLLYTSRCPKNTEIISHPAQRKKTQIKKRNIVLLTQLYVLRTTVTHTMQETNDIS